MTSSSRIIRFFLSVTLMLIGSVASQADILRKHDGEILDGKFLGGTEYVVYFHANEGRIDIPVSEILSLTFLPSSAALPFREPMPTPTSTPSPEELFITVPADTRVSVRLLSSLDSLSSRQGDAFEAVLAQDVNVGERLVFPKDTPVSGVVLRSEQGKTGSALVIELRELRLPDQRIPLRTSSYAMWDLPKSGEDTALRLIRTLNIEADALLGFKTLAPLTVDIR